MYRTSDNVNQNVQEQDSSREAVSRTHEVELDIQVLEERIAPGRALVDGVGGLNRSETLVDEHRAAELDIQVLEERIAPGVKLNRSETMVEQRAPKEVVELDIQVLEERIAPGISMNRSETMVVL